MKTRRFKQDTRAGYAAEEARGASPQGMVQLAAKNTSKPRPKLPFTSRSEVVSSRRSWLGDENR